MVNRFDRTAHAGPEIPDPSAAEGGTGPEALRRLQAQLEELSEYARLYAAARKDAILASTRNVALWAAAGVVGLVVVSAALVTAAVLGLVGLAQIIGIALGDRLWAGYLITGFGLLLIVALSFAAMIVQVRRRFRKQLVDKYAKRHASQRARFGHDVAQQAAGAAQRN